MTADAAVGQLLSAGDLPAPGGWRAALYRPDAPGAVLDGQPWARSWSAYLRAVLDPADASVRQFIANAMSERVPSEGGFLVPEQLRSQVLAYIAPAIVRPRAMVLPMASLRMGVPVLDNPDEQSGKQALGGLTFSAVEEGGSITATTPAFGRVQLEARKVAALLEDVPNELADDAGGAFGDFLARVIGAGYGWYEDDQFIVNGDGSSGPQSLVNSPCALNVSRSGTVPVFADIVAMAKALAPASKAAGLTPGVTSVAWLLSADAYDSLMEMYLNVGGSTAPTDITPAFGGGAWMDLGDGDTKAPSLLGLPAFITDHQPAAGTAGDVILADLRHYVVGDRLTMTVERSAAGAGFVKGTSNFRVRSRLDGRYWVQSKKTTQAGTQVSPVVVLE